MTKKLRPERAVKTALVYLLVLIVSFLFAFPCIWLVLSAFNAEGDLLTLEGFFPQEYSFDTFRRLFTETNKYTYWRWFGNTFFVAAVSCVISTFLVIAVAYTISRYRFKSRKAMMKATLILGIFPNFMNMTALFVIMTQLHLINNLWGLILLYSSGATMGFLVQKGFFDTIPSTIYDAATLDGASDFRVFVSITLPLSKPMIVYTALTSFVWPWADFMLPSMLLIDKSSWTVAVGLNSLDDSEFSIFAAGSMFAGEMHEPIRGTKNPQKMINSGIPFTKKPVAIQFDYKVKVMPQNERVRSTGFSRKTTVPGQDSVAVVLLLQKRWEDKEGNVYSKRVGTMVHRYAQSSNEWVNGAEYPILYGDITKRPEYRDYMRIQVEERYTTNSKGESVPIKEVGWANADDIPTHMVLQFVSSHGGAYIGSVGNTFWIDNIKLVY